jgi:multidrug resistance efflux pump
MEEKMTKTYEPDSQFVDRLEWQLASEFRRANSLKPASGKIAVPRRLVAVAVAFGVLTTGVTLIKAADYIKDSWRKKIEVAKVETEVKLKNAHLDYARERASEAETRFSSGLIQEVEYRLRKRQADKAALELETSLLNRDEVKASGQASRNELYAPIVSGRDFVSDRLKLEKEEVELDLEARKRTMERFKQLAEAGLDQRGELEAIQTEIAGLKGTIDKIQARLGLRKRFVAGEITAEEVEIKDRITVAKSDFQQAQTRVESLKPRLERLQDLAARGMISKAEAQQLRYALDAAQAELKLAALEVDVLEKIK